MSVIRHQRVVGRADALRILQVLQAQARETSGMTTNYWSAKIRNWIVVTKIGQEMFQIQWTGPRDCGC